MSLGLERFLAGEWDDALAELESSLDLAAEIGETYSVPYAHSLMSLISLHRNDLDRAAICAEAASREFAGRGAQYRTSWTARPQALVLEARGQRTQAQDADLLDAAVEAFARGSRPLELALALENAATAFVRHSDLERTRRLLGQAISIYERLGATRDLARLGQPDPHRAHRGRAGCRRNVQSAPT